jgi:hypothetical protein
MNPLVQYYLHQAGRGLSNGQDSGIGPIYAVPNFIQRGHGIGDTLGSLWLFVRPLLRTDAKSLGKESQRTGGQILSDLGNKPADISAYDVITASTQNLVKRLRGEGRRGRNSKTKTEGLRESTKKPKKGPYKQ